MRSLLEYITESIINEDAKDDKRLEDIKKKSGGDEEKAVKLAQQMNKAIKDEGKRKRRYDAAVKIFGAGSAVAAAFDPDGTFANASSDSNDSDSNNSDSNDSGEQTNTVSDIETPKESEKKIFGKLNRSKIYKTPYKKLKTELNRLRRFRLYAEFEKDFDTIRKKFITAMNNACKDIDDTMKFDTNGYPYNLINVEGTHVYSTGGWSSYKMYHDYWFNINVQDLTYGKYDWNGYLRSDSNGFDTVKKALKSAGVSISASGDSKRAVNKAITKIKKLPEYHEFCDELEKYNGIIGAYHDGGVLEDIRTNIKNALVSLGFAVVNNNKIYLRDVGYFFLEWSHFRETFVINYYNDKSHTPVSVIKKGVNEFIKNNSSVCKAEKRPGTTIPSILLNQDWVEKNCGEIKEDELKLESLNYDYDTIID